jgi:predicted ATP-grasp superfamily ATP-dependent carboligase
MTDTFAQQVIEESERFRAQQYAIVDSASREVQAAAALLTVLCRWAEDEFDTDSLVQQASKCLIVLKKIGISNVLIRQALDLLIRLQKSNV